MGTPCERMHCEKARACDVADRLPPPVVDGAGSVEVVGEAEGTVDGSVLAESPPAEEGGTGLTVVVGRSAATPDGELPPQAPASITTPISATPIVATRSALFRRRRHRVMAPGRRRRLRVLRSEGCVFNVRLPCRRFGCGTSKHLYEMGNHSVVTVVTTL